MDFYLGLAVVIATLAGPVLAVLVTRKIDEERQQRTRRMEVFRALMRTRRAPLAPDHVMALNMIEIEFYGVDGVTEAHRDLMTYMSDPKNAPNFDHHRSLLTKLLSKMADELGYSLPQLDVYEGGYYPKGFADLEADQQAIRKKLIERLSGDAVIRVRIEGGDGDKPKPSG